MVELAVAVGILMIVNVGAFGTLLQSFDLIKSSRGSNVAMTDLEVCMEQVLAETVDAIPVEFPEGAEIPGFTELHLSGQRITPSYPNLTGSSSTQPVLDIVLTSTWLDDRGRPRSLTLSTAQSR